MRREKNLEPSEKKFGDQGASIVENLEDRVLFSADVLVGLLPTEPENDSEYLSDDVPFSTEASSLFGATNNVASPLFHEFYPIEHDLEIPSSVTLTQLIVIDSGIANADQLVNDLKKNHGINTEVLLLEKAQDGIEQITNALTAEGREFASLHLVSHGDEGEIRLGDSILKASNLNQFSSQIALWKDGLASDADILLYGCDVAGSDSGEELVAGIGELTGADVAASDDVTGHKDFGGDWELEFIMGSVEADIAFSHDIQANYFGTFATVNVSTLDDVVDGDVSSVANLIANSGADGAISLREAMIAANKDSALDTIILGSGVHTLSLPGGDSSSGDLDIHSDINILGMADGSSIVDGAGIDRVFHINNHVVTINDLTIQGGLTNDPSGGAGIQVSSNSTLTLDNVVVSGNTSTTRAGGISVQGDLTIVDSTIVGNSAATDGGGLSLNSASGRTIVTHSTITANTAGEGGGVHVSSATEPHAFVNVTISGNTADNGGGFKMNGGAADLQNVTITNNDGTAGVGGVYRTSGTFTVHNSIIAGNAGTTAQEIQGTINSVGFNIVGDDLNDASGGVGYNGNDALNETGLLLGNLASNGGVVQTHALLTNSAGIDDGDTSGPPTDARGYARDALLDIGAYEAGATGMAPVEVTNNTVNVAEGGQTGIATSDLQFTDDNSSAVGVIYTETLNSAGQLELTSNPGVSITSFTQDDIDQGLLIYVHDGSEASTSQFEFDVEDEFGNTVFNQLFQFSVTAVNDAPVLDNSGVVTMTGITEDDINNNGVAVLSVIVSAGDIITDPDIDPEGFAIIDQSGGNGTWEYSTNSGSTWSSVGSVSDSSALLLGANSVSNKIRFVPDGFNAETPWIDVRAWDLSSGIAGTKVDATTTGGTTAFSDNVERVDLTVSAVNDAPVMNNAGVNSLTSIDVDDFNSAGTSIADIVASAGGDPITDVDFGSVEGIGIYSDDSSNGTWQYSTNGGGNWVVFSVPALQTLPLSDSALVRFVPNAGFSGVSQFSFVAWDQTSGTEGQLIGLAGNVGGSEAFGAESDVATINVSHAPETNDSVKVHPEGTLAFALDITATDADGSIAAFQLQSLPTNGLLYTNAGLTTLAATGIDYPSSGLTTVYFKPDPNFAGTTTFNYVAKDDAGVYDSTPATATITLTAVNDAPYFGALPDSEDTNVASVVDGNFVAAGDFDGDGDQDLVTSARFGDVTWHENDGTGNFVASNVIVTLAKPEEVIVADIDGNGTQDIVVANYSTGAPDDIVQLLNDGGGNFTAVGLPDSGDGIYSIDVGDIDSDGDLDIAAGGYTSDSIVWWEQDSGTWTLHTIASTDGPYSVKVADIDGDGSQDILSASFRDDVIQVHYSDGLADPSFTTTNIFALDAAFEATATDVDNDGDQDIVYANWGTSERLGWLENDGAAIPGFTEHVVDPGPWGTVFHASTADLNGDGNIDLVVSDSQISGQVVQYLGDGAGNFNKTVIDDAASSESNVVVDVDADGDLDIIALNKDTDTLGVHTNEGDGFIRAVTSEDTPVYLDPIVVFDIDSDPGELQASIVVGNGTIDLWSTTGLTFSQGDGADDATLIFTGTLADINSAFNRLRFYPLAEFSGVGSIQITLDDQSNTGTGGALSAEESLYIDIVPVNDSPQVVTGSGTVVEGGYVTVTPPMLQATDIDDADASLVYTVSNVTSGLFELSGAPGNAITSFTQQQINLGQIVFLHDGSEAPTSSFDFEVADGGEDGVVPVAGTYTFTVNPVNDAPIVASNTGASTTIGGSVILTSAMLNEGDVDDDGAGLTYAVTATSNGQMELVAVPGMIVSSFTQAQIDANEIIFVHDGLSGNNGGFDFDLADGLEDGVSPTSGTFDVTIGGATSDSYSTDEDTAVTVVAPGVLVNDGAGGVASVDGNVVVGFDASQDTGGAAQWNSNTGSGALDAGTGVTLTNSPTNPPTGITHAFDLDGSGGLNSSALHSYPDINATQSATLEAWIRFDTLTGTQVIFDSGDASGGVTLAMQGNQIELHVAENGFTSTQWYQGVISTNTWHHIAVTIDMTSPLAVEVWIDGELRLTRYPNQLSNWGDGEFGLGTNNAASAGGYAGSVSGQIAHFRVHDEVLSSADINANYANPGGGTATTPYVAGFNDSATLGDVDVRPDGSFDYDPSGQFENLPFGQTSTDTFDYTYDDGSGNQDTVSVTVSISGVNDAPVLSSATFTMTDINEDDTASVGNTVADIIASAVGDPITDVDDASVEGIAIIGTDSSAGDWKYSIDSGSSWNDLDVTSYSAARLLNPSALVRFEPFPNFSGPATFSFVAWDETSGSNGQLGNASISGGSNAFSNSASVVTINVNTVNDEPVTDDASVVFPEGTSPVALSLTASDTDGSIAAFRLQNLPTNGVLYEDAAMMNAVDAGLDYASSGPLTVYFVPNTNFVGTTTFNYVAKDDAGGYDSTPATATITMTAVNDAPVNQVPANQSVFQDTPLILSQANSNNISINDVDSQGNNVEVQLSATNGTLTLASTAGFASVTGDGSSLVTVVGPNSAIYQALNGLEFTPVAGFVGTATVAVHTNDLGNTGTGGPLQDSDSFNINVLNVNEAPLAVNDSYTIQEDQTLTTTLANGLLINDSDIDGDTISVGSVGSSSNASVTFGTDGTFTYTPNANFNGIDAFTYEITDGTLTAQATVTVTVSPVNEAPVLAAGSYLLTDIVEDDMSNNGNSVAEILASNANGGLTDVDVGSLAGIAVTGTDVTAGQWEYSSDGGGTWTNFGSVGVPNATVLDESARIRFVPNADYNGSSGRITFRGWDQTDGSSSGSTGVVLAGQMGLTGAFSGTPRFATLSVVPINDAPIAYADTYNTNEDTTISTAIGIDDLLLTDFDPDGDPLAVNTTPISAPLNGTLVLNNNGTFIYTPNIDFNGIDFFTYEINDGKGETAQATVSISIDAVNDAPTIDLDADDNSGTTGSGYNTAYITGGGYQSIVDVDATILDIDSTTLQSMTVRIVNLMDGSNESLDTTIGGMGVTEAYANGIYTVTGPAPLANFEQVLRSLTYHNASTTPDLTPRQIEVVVNDGDTDSVAATSFVDIVPDQLAPMLTNNTGVTINENEYVRFDSSALQYQDLQPATSLLYTVATAPANGILTLSSTAAGLPATTFTQDDVDRGRVKYFHDGSETSSDSFTFTVDDGQGNVTSIQSLNIVVNPINDAPVISYGDDFQLTNIFEDNFNAAGDTVADLIASVSADRITDAEGDAQGIAVLVSDNSNGTWQYKVASNLSWTSMPLLSGGSGGFELLLLDAGSLVRFVPDPNYFGSSGDITFSAWDGTDGNAAGSVLTYGATAGGFSGFGFTNAFSVPAGIASLTVNPVNDAPTIDLDAIATGNNFSSTYTEGGLPVDVAASDANILDIEADDYSSLMISLNGFSDGPNERLTVGNTVFGYTYPALPVTTTIGATNFLIEFDGTMVSISNVAGGAMPQADLTALLRSVQYEYVGNNPTIGNRTIEFVVTDQFAASSQPAISTVSVLSVNDAPETNDTQVVTSEDAGGVPIEIAGSDPDGSVASFEIKALPLNGTLYTDPNLLNPVIVGNTYAANSGKLTFFYGANNNFNGADSFEFAAVDNLGMQDSTPSTASITIAPVNDFPIGLPAIVGVPTEDQILTANTSGISDVDVAGTLTYQWTRNGIPISGAAASNYTLGDADVNAIIAVEVRYQDSYGTDEGPLISAPVGPIGNVNDEPQGTDTSLTVVEDSALVIKSNDFGFSDPIDNDDFQSVVISSIPVEGELSLDGSSVSVNQVIAVNDINSGLLVYTPPMDAVGVGYEGFSFYVQDDGGTANAGVDTDQTHNNITFDLQGINDAPLLVTGTQSVEEGDSVIIGLDALNAIDADDDDPDELSFAVIALPEYGQLLIGGQPVVTGTSFSLAAIQQNQLVYVHDGSETSADSFVIEVSDGGEDGVVPVSGSLTIQINEVIDPAPIIDNETLQLNFGQSFSSQGSGALLESGETTLAARQLFDNPNLVVSLVTPPLYGTLTLNSDGTFNYQHDGGLELEDSFEFEVTNEDNVSTRATVSIFVEPKPNAATEVVIPDSPLDFTYLTQPPTPSETTSEVVQASLPQINGIDFAPEATGSDGEQSADTGLQILELQGKVVFVLEQISIVQHNSVSLDVAENDPYVLSPTSLIALESGNNFGLYHLRFLDGLRQVDKDMQQADDANKQRYKLARDAAISVSIGTTAGIIAWALRGGALLSSVLSTTPLWTSIDPIFVSSEKRKTDQGDEHEVEEYFSHSDQ